MLLDARFREHDDERGADFFCEFLGQDTSERRQLLLGKKDLDALSTLFPSW